MRIKCGIKCGKIKRLGNSTGGCLLDVSISVFEERCCAGRVVKGRGRGRVVEGRGRVCRWGSVLSPRAGVVY